LQGTAGSREPLGILKTEFAALLKTHGRIIGSVARAYGRTPEETRDLAQEIATHAWSAFGRYDRTRSFSTWLYRVSLNVAISHARARVFRDDVQTELPHDDVLTRDASHDERSSLLHFFIAQLDPLNRALVLLYVEGHSHREIADVFGLTETNVATKLTRMKSRLREMNLTQGENE
jgi:RNA polymerase sigma-70 factor (ECF subfamily)